jgi:hypothetical protein
MTHELVGKRIKMMVTKDVYPIGIFQVGTTGIVVEVGKDLISVELDEQRDELEKWGNELHWYIDDYAPGSVLLDEFLDEVVVLDSSTNTQP